MSLGLQLPLHNPSDIQRSCESVKLSPPSDLNALLSTKRGNCCCSGSQLEPHLLFTTTDRVNKNHKYKYCTTCCHSDGSHHESLCFCSSYQHHLLLYCAMTQSSNGTDEPLTSCQKHFVSRQTAPPAEIEAMKVFHKRLSVFSSCLCESVPMQFFKVFSWKLSSICGLF